MPDAATPWARSALIFASPRWERHAADGSKWVLIRSQMPDCWHLQVASPAGHYLRISTDAFNNWPTETVLFVVDGMIAGWERLANEAVQRL